MFMIVYDNFIYIYILHIVYSLHMILVYVRTFYSSM